MSSSEPMSRDRPFDRGQAPARPRVRQICAALAVLAMVAGGCASDDQSDSGASPGDGSPVPSITGSTCENFGTIFSSGNLYFVMNNVFNDTATSQCFAVAGTGFTVTTANHNIAPNGLPATYVAIVRGCHFGNCSANSDLPKLVSTITSAPTSFAVHTAGDIWDASYDVWFDHTTNTTSRNNGLELMIWLDSAGVMPIGNQVDTATIAGASWQVWYSASASPPVISYRRATATASVSFDLELFMADAMTRNTATGKAPAGGSPALDAAWYMTSIQAGFELWKGGQGAAVTSFAAAIH